MALKAKRYDVWTATIEDRAGGAASVLEKLAKAKISLDMMFARRLPEHPGSGMLVVGPIKGKKAEAAALAAGVAKTGVMHGVKVEGGDKPGLGAKIARTLGNAGISFRGISADVIGRKFVCHLALDNPQDADRAVALLKKL
jgi:predicted amino acid-binding ACT domain protein